MAKFEPVGYASFYIDNVSGEYLDTHDVLFDSREEADKHQSIFSGDIRCEIIRMYKLVSVDDNTCGATTLLEKLCNAIRAMLTPSKENHG